MTNDGHLLRPNPSRIAGRNPASIMAAMRAGASAPAVEPAVFAEIAEWQRWANAGQPPEPGPEPAEPATDADVDTAIAFARRMAAAGIPVQLLSGATGVSADVIRVSLHTSEPEPPSLPDYHPQPWLPWKVWPQS